MCLGGKGSYLSCTRAVAMRPGSERRMVSFGFEVMILSLETGWDFSMV